MTTDKTQSQRRTVKIYFPMLPVFDIAQTDFDPPRNWRPQHPNKAAHRDDGKGVVALVCHHTTGQGWTAEAVHIKETAARVLKTVHQFIGAIAEVDLTV